MNYIIYSFVELTSPSAIVITFFRKILTVVPQPRDYDQHRMVLLCVVFILRIGIISA